MKSNVTYLLILVSWLTHSLQAQDMKSNNEAYMRSLLSEDFRKFYNEDSLKTILAGELYDTARAELLVLLARSYQFKQPDSSLYYAKKAIKFSREIGYTKSILNGLRAEGEAHRPMANFTEALKSHFELLQLSEQIGNIDFETTSIGFIGINYFDMRQFEQALGQLKRAVAMSKPIHHELTKMREAFFNIYLARTYNEINQSDSAFYYLNEAGRINTNPNRIQFNTLRALCVGDVYLKIGNKDSAKFYYKRTLKLAQGSPSEVTNSVSAASYKLALIYDVQNQNDSSLFFARNAYRIAKYRGLKLRILDASTLLAKLHREGGRLDSALYYQDIAIAMDEIIYGKNKFREMQVLLLEEQQRTEKIQRAEERRMLEVEQAQKRFQNNVLIIGLITITTIILVASILLFRSNRIKQKSNLALQQTLRELKATQSQLIQSEKMASLGELTAGIAHEIQNPLNFVNNFSEVSNELVQEMEAEIQKGNLNDAKVIAIDVKQNLEKILQHGKRADGIVKSMLQHSRSSSGEKELTDINVLCDEYLRLAYHGYRAKDKSFNAKFETDFDSSLGKISVVPQDIGRVVLNLVNNAFYAVNENGKQTKRDTSLVTVSTKRSGDSVSIFVKDNGNGIPQHLVDKIFQPFFTTKPTGQGTGLGLSLSYDIVKAHGGELKAETKEGEGSTFIIQLPG